MPPANNILKKVPAAILALPLIIMGGIGYRLADGHFVYSLDDPYIHLALAKNIFHGHYGVNPGEFGSVSSSILWPFILSVFYPTGAFFEYIPLIINTLCTISSGVILLRIFNFTNVFKRTLIVLLIALSFNLYGLAFTGMEHSLQVMLTLWVLRKIIREQFDSSLFFVLVVLPLIRYECLSVSLPVLCIAFLKGYRKKSILAFLLIGSTIGAFSLFLYVNQQSILPNSVVSKTFMTSKASLFFLMRSNLQSVGIFLLLAAYLILQGNKIYRNWGILLFLNTALFVAVGRIGGFVRYDVFYFISIYTVITYHLLKKQPNLITLVFLLPVINAYMLSFNFLTPRATSNIYRQQKQMGKIVQLLQEKIGVNDLGIVSLTSTKYVLDLWGIGTKKSLDYQIKFKGTNQQLWMDSIMKEYDVHYAMIYETWFKKIPENWIKVGELSITEKNRTLGGRTVSFFATSAAYAPKFRKVLETYQHSGIPSRTSLTLTPLPH